MRNRSPTWGISWKYKIKLFSQPRLWFLEQTERWWWFSGGWCRLVCCIFFCCCRLYFSLLSLFWNLKNCPEVFFHEQIVGLREKKRLNIVPVGFHLATAIREIQAKQTFSGHIDVKIVGMLYAVPPVMSNSTSLTFHFSSESHVSLARLKPIRCMCGM